MTARCLPPRLALEVLSGTKGTRDQFFTLASALNVSGVLAAMNLEQHRLGEIKAAQQTVARSFLAASNSGIWAVTHGEFPALALGLEIFDCQLGQATLSAALAAEYVFSEKLRVNREAKEAIKKAA